MHRLTHPLQARGSGRRAEVPAARWLPAVAGGGRRWGARGESEVAGGGSTEYFTLNPKNIKLVTEKIKLVDKKIKLVAKKLN